MIGNDDPGLYRYSLKIKEYKKLDDIQYARTIAALQSGSKAERESARELLICSHLGMVLKVAQAWQYKRDLSECVGLGNFTLVERFDKFDPERGKFSTYMSKEINYRIAHSKYSWRIYNRDNDLEINNVGKEDKAVEIHENHIRLNRALRQLSEEEQSIIRHSYFNSPLLPEEEVAKKFRCTINFLHEMKKSIYLKLRMILKEKNPGNAQRFDVERTGGED